MSLMHSQADFTLYQYDIYLGLYAASSLTKATKKEKKDLWFNSMSSAGNIAIINEP